MEALVQLREEFSKWLMRTKQAGQVLRLPLFFITAVSTMVTALKGTFLDGYTFQIGGVFVAGSAFFIWAYDRFQVMNMQNRWNTDRTDNYVAAPFLMGNMTQARMFATLSKSINEDWSPEQTEQELERVVEDCFREFRNGVNPSEYE